MRQRSLTPDDLEQMAKVSVFAGLGGEGVAQLVQRGTVREFEAPSLLFSSGEVANCFYVVLAGEVHLFALTADGDQGLVAMIGAGESFAEAAMFGSGRFPVNAEAQAGSTLVRVEKKAIEAALRANPDLAFRLLGSLLDRQSFLITEIHHLKAQSPCQRLASYLLSLFESGRWPGSGRLPQPKQIIASRIGVDPSSLSRALRRLDVAGIVCVRDDVVIEDVERLRAYCADFESNIPMIKEDPCPYATESARSVMPSLSVGEARTDKRPVGGGTAAAE